SARPRRHHPAHVSNHRSSRKHFDWPRWSDPAQSGGGGGLDVGELSQTRSAARHGMTLILGIETSCDETSAAILEDVAGARPQLRSLVILSQDIHRVF